jgi:hypothetical protein
VAAAAEGGGGGAWTCPLEYERHSFDAILAGKQRPWLWVSPGMLARATRAPAAGAGQVARRRGGSAAARAHLPSRRVSPLRAPAAAAARRAAAAARARAAGIESRAARRAGPGRRGARGPGGAGARARAAPVDWPGSC